MEIIRMIAFEDEAAKKDKAIVHHGSQKIIKVPEFGAGNIYNDYGQGFYLIRNKDLAGEWAVLSTARDGYINSYQLDYDDLSVLYLDREPFEVWVAVLMSNRRGDYSDVVQERAERFIAKYGKNFPSYDIIEGWRADDSYFTYVRDFLTISLSLEKLKESMKLGNLGTQICLKSEKSFAQIEWKSSDIALASRFYTDAKLRDDNARNAYRRLENKMSGTLIIDMVGRDV